MEQYEAIFYRRSVRRYQKESLPENVLSNLRRYMERLTPLYPGEPYEILLIDALANPRAVKGLWMAEAPYYLVFCGNDTESGRQNAGYLAEQLTLYLTAREIGTCYQGAAKIRQEAAGFQKPVLFAVAFGPAEEVFREPEKAKRLSQEKLALCKEKPGEEAQAILRAARMAPSAFNSQPWRFVVYRNRIHLFARREKLAVSGARRMQDVDIGIVLYHMMLAAEELWLTADLRVSETIAERRLKNNRNVLSLFWKNI